MSSPWDGSGMQGTDCAVGPRKPATRFAIAAYARFACTAGAVERLGLSLAALLEAEERLYAAVVWHRTGQPRTLKRTINTVLDTLGEVFPRAPGKAPPPTIAVGVLGGWARAPRHWAT